MNRRLQPAHMLKMASLHAAFWLVVWPTPVFGEARGSEDSYAVKRGDTIYSIARQYGIPPRDLADCNGLSRSFHVYAGQRLIIPHRAFARRRASSAHVSAQARERSVLPRAVQRAVDKAPVQPGRWRYIVIHHSGVDTGTVEAMDHYHRAVRHMENGLAYDFVIGNGSGMGDGEIAVGPRWTHQLDGGHLASEAQNKIAIGICLVGNFDGRRPTPRALDSLRALVQALMVRCDLTPNAVKTHQQINVVHTRCPGARFPTQSFLDSLQSPAR